MQPKPSAQMRVGVRLRAVDHDTETAETLVQHSPHSCESIRFSCQQLVEKYAKAVLITDGLPASLIHVLMKLLVPLVQAFIIILDVAEMDSAAVLPDLAVEWCYKTDDTPSYTSAELLAMAHQFRDKLCPLALAFLT